jgi:hypothetical protein
MVLDLKAWYPELSANCASVASYLGGSLSKHFHGCHDNLQEVELQFGPELSKLSFHKH